MEEKMAGNSPGLVQSLGTVAKTVRQKTDATIRSDPASFEHNRENDSAARQARILSQSTIKKSTLTAVSFSMQARALETMAATKKQKLLNFFAKRYESKAIIPRMSERQSYFKTLES